MRVLIRIKCFPPKVTGGITPLLESSFIGINRISELTKLHRSCFHSVTSDLHLVMSELLRFHYTKEFKEFVPIDDENKVRGKFPSYMVTNPDDLPTGHLVAPKYTLYNLPTCYELTKKPGLWENTYVWYSPVGIDAYTLWPFKNGYSLIIDFMQIDLTVLSRAILDHSEDCYVCASCGRTLDADHYKSRFSWSRVAYGMSFKTKDGYACLL